MLDALLPQLAGFEILDPTQRRADLAFVRVPQAELFSLLARLKQQHGFVSLATIACTDRIEDEVFCLSYLLENAARDRCLGVQTWIRRDAAALETAIPLWPQAEVFERELNEMFGIPILGHPSLGDFMLEGWTHTPPMRREFDTLEFVEETFVMREGREDGLNVRDEIRRRKEEKRAEKAAQAQAKAKDTPAGGRSDAPAPRGGGS